jgi:hypothetical protein
MEPQYRVPVQQDYSDWLMSNALRNAFDPRIQTFLLPDTDIREVRIAEAGLSSPHESFFKVSIEQVTVQSLTKTTILDSKALGLC